MKHLSPTLVKLIKLLNDGKFHSGASLGEALNISRNAIWKHINQLIKYEVDIESAQSKGYCLKQPLILLDKKIIKKNIHYTGKFYPEKIEILGSIASTNDYLKTNAAHNVDEIAICLAEYQTAGRGRFGRSWYCPFGANINLSCRWSVSKDVSKLSGLSLVVALAVMEALKEYQFKNNLAIKWPNDILWQGKKLAGILVEMSAESHGATQIIIGIGLNVNMPASAKTAIDCHWESLEQIMRSYQDRNKIAGLLINSLLHHLQQFEEEGTFNFTRQWKQHDYLLDKKLVLKLGKNNAEGIARGINAEGHLLLQQADDKITAYSAGEASLHL